MEIAKDHSAQDSRMALLQACSFYGNVYGAPGAPDPSSLFGFEIHDQTVLEEGESSDNTSGSDSVKNFSFSRLPSLSGSSNSKNTAFVFEPTTNSLPEEVQSVINFKTGYDNWGRPTESLFSFEQGEYSNFDDAMDKNDVWNTKCSIDSRLSNDSNCFEMASVYGLMNTTATSIQLGEERGGWLYSGALDADESVQQFGGPDKCSDRRPFMGEEMQALKRQCTGVVKKPKHKSAPAKDPQSIAAKNRRERISERLKILQDLVPNGAKVDLVTMLEKAISYVKFLQLQVKVLATDEFWPVQGGKAPEISQVKEAIDAILSSHHKDNSCSSSK